MMNSASAATNSAPITTNGLDIKLTSNHNQIAKEKSAQTSSRRLSLSKIPLRTAQNGTKLTQNRSKLEIM